MKSQYRVTVEWWDADRQRTVVVCSRKYGTRRAAERKLNQYTVHSFRADEYRGSIQWLGYQPEVK